MPKPDVNRMQRDEAVWLLEMNEVVLPKNDIWHFCSHLID
jgi:hypothetical protein